jgi:hypothetical protein
MSAAETPSAALGHLHTLVLEPSMSQAFLRFLRSRYRVPTGTSRTGEAPYFQVFDRHGKDHLGWNSAPPGGMQSHRRVLWTRPPLCEIYLFGGDTDETLTLELQNIYRACRDATEAFVDNHGGTVENRGAVWLARMQMPLTSNGGGMLRQLAEIFHMKRRGNIRFRHRMKKCADELESLSELLMTFLASASRPDNAKPTP